MLSCGRWRRGRSRRGVPLLHWALALAAAAAAIAAVAAIAVEQPAVAAVAAMATIAAMTTAAAAIFAVAAVAAMMPASMMAAAAIAIAPTAAAVEEQTIRLGLVLAADQGNADQREKHGHTKYNNAVHPRILQLLTGTVS